MNTNSPIIAVKRLKAIGEGKWMELHGGSVSVKTQVAKLIDRLTTVFDIDFLPSETSSSTEGLVLHGWEVRQKTSWMNGL